MLCRSLFRVALPLLAAGCYESSQPLGPADRGVLDLRLAGTWRCVDSADKPTQLAHLLIVPFDRSQFFIEYREEGKTERYRAYATPVQDKVLYNVAEIKPRSAPRWAFHRAVFRPDGSLVLWIVDADQLKEKDEAAVLKEIARRVDDDTLYKRWAACALEK